MSNYILLGGELYHWKYTKREKINGKWRYWYGDTDKDLEEKAKDDLQTKYVEGLNELARKDGDSRYSGSDRLEKLGNEFKYDPSASKLQNTIDGIKDSLGVDERNQYAWTKHVKQIQDEDLARWQKEAEAAYETYQRLPTAGGWTNYTNKERMVTAKSYDAEVANKFYNKYKEEFEKTPLGKVHIATEKAKAYIDDIVDKTKKRLKIK